VLVLGSKANVKFFSLLTISTAACAEVGSDITHILTCYQVKRFLLKNHLTIAHHPRVNGSAETKIMSNGKRIINPFDSVLENPKTIRNQLLISCHTPSKRKKIRFMRDPMP